MRKILLFIDYSSDFDRRLLRGLVRYAKENTSWSFYRLPLYYVEMYGSKGAIEFARKWEASAIIGKWTEDTVNLQKELGIPVVLQNYHHRSIGGFNLTGAYEETGKMAALFFKKRMFENFAYFGIKGVVWSDERKEGYEREIKRFGGNFFSFEMEDQDKDELREEIIHWLLQLPKPVALFCCDDVHALFIAETCKIIKIAIPEDLALLGVDNDELMCNISDPPISSIELDVEKGGYMLGKLVDKLLKKEYTGSFNIVINPIRIELRQSTEKYNIKDPYVLKVVRYINAHYSADLSVNTLLAHVPLSRRSLEFKFKDVMRISVYQYILSIRCSHLANLLLTTDRTLRELGKEVGFKSHNNVPHIFKKYQGSFPDEYRRKKEYNL